MHRPCMAAHIRQWDNGPSRPLILLNTTAATTSRSGRDVSGGSEERVVPSAPKGGHRFGGGRAPPSLALVGSGRVMAEVRRHEMLIAGETLPLPIASAVGQVVSEVRY